MQLKTLSLTVAVSTTATYSWAVVNTTCATVNLSEPLLGGLTAGVHTLSQIVEFSDNCALTICLIVTDNDCTNQLCFDLENNTTFPTYGWNCALGNELLYSCQFSSGPSSTFPTLNACETCIASGICDECLEILCSDYEVAATYDCVTGISLSWIGAPYTGMLPCIYLTINTVAAPCTENIIAQNILGTALSGVTGLLSPGTYSVNFNVVLANGCVISSNPIVVNCPDNPQVEWNLECCQTVDTAGVTAGYADKYYILDVTNNDLSEPLYVDFSFFQVADRLKFYDLANVTFTDGLPNNLDVLTPFADTAYVGKPLSCYLPAVSNNLYYGFMEKEDNDPPLTQSQPISVMNILSPPWSLLYPCNNSYTQSFNSSLPCPQCQSVNSVYIIPKNCAVEVSDCEPVDIIGCGRLTISGTALTTLTPIPSLGIIADRKKIFIHLESNDCNTGCTAAVFKILCPGCYGCDIPCTVDYVCNTGLEFTDCVGLSWFICTYDVNGAEVCLPATEGQILVNGTYFVKVINTTIDNCYKIIPLEIDCPACYTPDIRSFAGVCKTQEPSIGFLRATIATAHPSVDVYLGVKTSNPGYVAGQYVGMYIGTNCVLNTCPTYTLISSNTVVGNYEWYGITAVSVTAFTDVLALFSDNLGTFIDLPNGLYKFTVDDKPCTSTVSMEISCVDCDNCENDLIEGYQVGMWGDIYDNNLITGPATYALTESALSTDNLSASTTITTGILTTAYDAVSYLGTHLNQSYSLGIIDVTLFTDRVYNPLIYNWNATFSNTSLIPNAINTEVNTWIYKDSTFPLQQYQALIYLINLSAECNDEDIMLNGQIDYVGTFANLTFNAISINNAGIIGVPRVPYSNGLNLTAVPFTVKLKQGVNEIIVVMNVTNVGSATTPAYTNLDTEIKLNFTVLCV